MGCANSKIQELSPIRLQTVNGVVKVKIINAKILHETSSFFAMDPYIKLKISNQSVTTNVDRKGGKQPTFLEQFDFFINSCYQTNGRNLQLQLWDSNKTADSLIGFGMTDLDPILQSRESKDDEKSKKLRIFLNYHLKPAGFVNINVQFTPQPIFQTVTIRRKTSSTMNCYVKVTIGEEVLKTKKKKDTPEMPPVWIDQFLTFNTMRIIKNCLVQVYDEDEIVGQLQLKVQDLLNNSTKQCHHDQEIIFKDAIAGSLKFQTLTGEKPHFSQIKKDYKRKTQEPKPELKEEDKKKAESKEAGKKSEEKAKQQSKQGQKSKQTQKLKQEQTAKLIQQNKP